MQSRLVPILRVLTVVLVVGIGVVLFFLLRHFITDDRTPQTDLERAVYAAEEAVRATPEDANARIKLAAAYLEAGSLSFAKEQADIAVRLAPADPSVYYMLGLVQKKQGDVPGAIASLERAAGMQGQLAAFYQDVWAALAVTYEEQGDVDKALTALDKALDFGPENSLLLTRRAGIYERSEQWADALYDYAQALSFVPDNEDALAGFERITTAHPEAIDEVMTQFGVDLTNGVSSQGMTPSTETTSP